MTKDEKLIEFIKSHMITKANGINPKFSKTPIEFLNSKNAPKEIYSHITRESFADFVYSLGIIVPKKASKFCLECGVNECHFLNLPKGYRLFCSHRCSEKSEISKKLREEGMLKAHGVTNSMKSPKSLAKREATCMRKYGTKAACQSPEVRAKIEATNEERYGFKNPNKNEKVKEKIKNTCLERFGFITNLQAEWCKEKIRKTNNEKYGCDNVGQNEEIKKTIKQRLNEIYNVDNIQQLHLKNMDDLNEEFVKEHFIKDGVFLRIEFEKYFNILSSSTSDRYKDKFNISENNKRYKISQAEENLASLIKSDIVRNSRKIIPPLEIDIYLPEAKLAIEYNGLMYHSRGFHKSSKMNTPDFPRDYHLNKTKLCEEQGIQLLHIFEGESLDIWLSMIHSKLGLNEKLYARKCVVKEIKFKEASEFLEANHLQGVCNSKVNLGLFKDEELVSIMTFGRSRFNKQYDWELLRFCSKKNFNVVGAASKLLKYFRNKNQGSIISYANRRWSNGSLYEKLGFTKIKETDPNYFYFKENCWELLSRVKFQKHKLKDILENFDENLSETQNMLNHGYRQIFDCGNLVYVLE